MELILILTIVLFLLCFGLGLTYFLQNAMWAEMCWRKKDKWYMNPFGLFKTKNDFRISIYFCGIICFLLGLALIFFVFLIVSSGRSF